MPAIPTTIDDVTPQWLSEVLRDSGALRADGDVVELSTEQIGAGVGIMGELHRLTPRYDGADDDAPTSVIVKLPSPYEANRAQGVGLGMYEAEVRFYRELAVDTPVRTPVCHFGEIVSGTAEFALVLQDLSALELGDQIEGMSVAHAEATALALADLHAAWWGRVETPALEWVPSIVHDRIQGLAAMWPDLWQAFSGTFGDRLPDGALPAGDRIAAAYWSLMEELGRRPWTLLHQDLRVENVFFDADGPVVIDWQGLGRGPGAYDLAYLLGGSLRVEDRRAHEHDIVDRYHRRLTERGVSGYGRDDLWRDYRMAHLVNTATPVLVGATMDLANERGRDLIATLGQRHFSAVVDLDAVELIP